MPTTFFFSDNSLRTEDYLTHSQLTRGSFSGVNDPTEASAVAPNQDIDVAGDVDIIAVTLFAGQDYTFDIDQGFGDSSGGSVDLEFDLIDSRGGLIHNDGESRSTDSGSFSTLDPLSTFRVDKTGTYYIAVHSEGVDYRDDQFRFTGTGGTGDYTFILSSPGVPTRTVLTNGSDDRTFSDARQNVLALAGNDIIDLRGGRDIASGGDGRDTIFGGAQSDELSGGNGQDELFGGTADDVLIGGVGNDDLFGGSETDALNGGAGNDLELGGIGHDSLMGHSGRDVLSGGGGIDFLRGGVGVDRLRGGASADTFHFLQGEATFNINFVEDRIMDFQSVDVIDLSDVIGGRLDFIGSQNFDDDPGTNEVRVANFRSSRGFQEVQVNLDADSQIELAIIVFTQNDFTLREGDFLL